ncbi:UNVERIFIED_CONTAM: hypothetical protein K2H54_058881, partial [Gekko kuhli]
MNTSFACYVWAKAHVPVEKLQAAQQFLKKIYPDESNGKINYEQKKEVTFLEDPSGLSSPLPKMPTRDTERAVAVVYEMPGLHNMYGPIK